MNRPEPHHSGRSWEGFVIDHRHQAAAADLAFILRRPFEEINRLRATGACSKSAGHKDFTELFTLWRGRKPDDDEWPPPRIGGRGSYEWQGPELALLASLVGRLGKTEIMLILTERLRRQTGDAAASCSIYSVQIAINRIGMLSKDVVGGITVADAGQEIGSLAIVNQAIHKGDIRALRVGRRWVIPHDSWAAGKPSGSFLQPDMCHLLG